MSSTPNSPERTWQEIPLLATKLYVPSPRPNLVARPRLLAALDEGLSQRLVLVAAPAGFGKTTVLAEWVAGRGLRCAWVSLDEGDSDPVRFCTYAIAALQRIAPTVGEAALEWLRAPQPPPMESVLTLLINDLCQQNEELVLVLDDYHVLGASAVHQAVTVLLDHLPPSLHLVISTRADPPLPLARWRARGQMIEVRADDLRFTFDEAVQFCKITAGLDLLPMDVEALQARTEGWIVGLKMAALSMQGRAGVEALVESFSGSHRYVLDYLLEEVLDRQPADTQAFLLQTSILEQLCGPLCDAVTGQDRSQAMLEGLERANLFVVPLDDERHWYRYHRLFSDLLRARLAQSCGGQQMADLHRRAGGWYEAHGLTEEAIRHALACRDDDRAARMIERISEDAWLHGEFQRLLSWIEALPGELVRSRPWLCVWYVWTLLQSGTVEGVNELINDLARMSANQLGSQREDAPADARAWVDQVATLQIIAASGLRHDPAEMLRLASQALARPPADGRTSTLIARCEMLYNVGFALYLTGELTKAEQTYQDAQRLARKIGFLLRDILVTYKLALIHEVTGRLHEPYRLYQETLASVQEQGKEAFFGTGYLCCGMSHLLYEWDRLEQARERVAESFRLNEVARVPHLLIDSYNAQARLSIAQGELDGAQAALQRAAELIQKHYCWPEVIGKNESYQVRVWLAKGDLSSAIRWAEGRQPAAQEAPGSTEEWVEIARARVLMAQGALNEAAVLLDRLARSAEAGGRTGRLIEILVLQAITLHAQNEGAQALTVVEKALSLAEPEGYVRVFVDEGAPMVALLRRAASCSHVPAYANRLLAACGEEPQDMAAGKPTSMLVEPLTERELEVLRLVAQGLSNGEIAEALIIAIGTVKAHVHHIYGKLEVSGRVQAIARARELGLCPR